MLILMIGTGFMKFSLVNLLKKLIKNILKVDIFECRLSMYNSKEA